MSKVARQDREALFLGRVDRPGRRRWVRGPADALPTAADAVISGGGQAPHVLTIAPNDAGRDRSCVLPNLLNYAGQAVVFDVGGKAYAASADARRSMGQLVMRLDPFGVAGPESHTYSPFDWIDPKDMSVFASDCLEIAELLSCLGNSYGNVGQRAATALVGALLGYLYGIPEKKFDDLYSTLHSDDVIYSLAVALDTRGKRMHPASYTEITSFLERGDRIRSRILATATSMIKGLGSPEVQKALQDSAFDFPSQRPVTVYVILPAEQLAHHSALARLWIGFLLLRTARAADKPALPALFLLDHCAELAPFPLVERALAAAPTGSLRIWTFWDDVQQLRAACPRRWPAITAGAGAVQVFGTSDPQAADEVAAVLGLPADQIRSLGPGDQIVRLDGAAPCRVRRLDARDVSSRPLAAAET
jgi:type IV secretion system protein VirD4